MPVPSDMKRRRSNRLVHEIPAAAHWPAAVGARLRAYAYGQDRRLADVARDIVARRLRLHPDPAQDTEA